MLTKSPLYAKDARNTNSRGMYNGRKFSDGKIRGVFVDTSFQMVYFSAFNPEMSFLQLLA